MYKLPFQSPKLFSLSSLIPCCTPLLLLFTSEAQRLQVHTISTSLFGVRILHVGQIAICKVSDTPKLTPTPFTTVKVPVTHPSSHPHCSSLLVSLRYTQAHTHTIHYHQCPYVFLQFLCLPLHVGWQC